MRVFDHKEILKLYRPKADSSGEQNGQVTIIGGSKLFHGAPLLSLKVASRVVDMVFFSSPEPSVGDLANRIKSDLLSFIWIPWEEIDSYIAKSDAVLIGPGFMRYESEERKEISDKKNPKDKEDLSLIASRLSQSLSYDSAGKLTRKITEKLLRKFPNKRWVIDAGSLQVMDAEWIPEGAILTPNKKEFELLFRKDLELRGQSLDCTKKNLTSNLQYLSSKYNCTIVLKGAETIVCSPNECVLVKGGNAGMTKGGTGDVLAGLTVALLAKNDPFLAAASASYIAKKAADELYEKVGTNYNADDLADKIPETIKKLI